MKNKKNVTYFISGILLISLLVLIVQSKYINKTAAQPVATSSNLGTFSSPEVAYQECKTILTEVSRVLNTSEKNH